MRTNREKGFSPWGTASLFIRPFLCHRVFLGFFCIENKQNRGMKMKELQKRLQVSLPGLELKNPIMPASGTFGFGELFLDKLDYNDLGAVVLKSVTLEPRIGNPDPKYYHFENGDVLNSVGIKNPGVQTIVDEKLPALANFQTPVIASVAGSTVEEYVEVARILSASLTVSALEINVSCPNVKEGGVSFGTDPELVKEITERIKAVVSKPIYVKLTPNVADIKVIAKAAEAGGADGISMINTLLGLKIDLATRRPFLGGVTGGISGPGIKPLAIRMVNEVARTVSIPIIGMGGLRTADDVLEMIMAGASAVMIGSENYANPQAMPSIIRELPARMDHWGIDSISGLIKETKNLH